MVAMDPVITQKEKKPRFLSLDMVAMENVKVGYKNMDPGINRKLFDLSLSKLMSAWGTVSI